MTPGWCTVRDTNRHPSIVVYSVRGVPKGKEIPPSVFDLFVYLCVYGRLILLTLLPVCHQQRTVNETPISPSFLNPYQTPMWERHCDYPRSLFVLHYHPHPVKHNSYWRDSCRVRGHLDTSNRKGIGSYIWCPHVWSNESQLPADVSRRYLSHLDYLLQTVTPVSLYHSRPLSRLRECLRRDVLVDDTTQNEQRERGS